MLSKIRTTLTLFNRNLDASKKLASLAAFSLSVLRAIAQVVTPLSMAQLAQAVAENNDEINIFPGITDKYTLTQTQVVWLYFGLQAGIWVVTPVIQTINDRLQMVIIDNLMRDVLKQTAKLSQQQIEQLENDPHIRVLPNMKRILEDGISVFEMLITSFLTDSVEVIIANAIAFWQLGLPQGTAFLIFSSSSLTCDYFMANHLDVSAWKYYEKVTSIYNETIEALKTIRVSGNIFLQNRLLLEAWEQFRKLQTKINNATQGSITIKNMVASSAIAAYLGAIVHDGSVTKDEIDDLIFLLGYMNRLMGLLVSIDRNFLSLQTRMASFNKLDTFLKVVPEVRATELTQEDMGTNHNPVVKFENCNFTFDLKQPAILRNVNLAINARQYNALVGKSGSGKTTILQLLLGFYEPQETLGPSIKVFGKNLSQIVLSTYYPYVGWVPQQPESLIGNFRYNVLISYYGEKIAAVTPNRADSESEYEKIYQEMINPLVEEAILEEASIRAQLYTQLCYYYTSLARLYIENSVVAPANKIFNSLIALSHTRFIDHETWNNCLCKSSQKYKSLITEIFAEFEKDYVQTQDSLSPKFIIVPICIIDPFDNPNRVQKHKWQALVFSFPQKLVSYPKPKTATLYSHKSLGSASPLNEKKIHSQVIVYILNNLTTEIQEIQVELTSANILIKLLHKKYNEINSASINNNITNSNEYNYDFLLMVISLHNFVYNELNHHYKQKLIFSKHSNKEIINKIADFEEYRYPDNILELSRNRNIIEDAVKFLRKFVKLEDLFELDLLPLSGGEMQRLGAARVFAKKNLKLLLLDEPTSALDAFTEAELIRNYKKTIQSTATLAVSHRLFTIKDAKQITWIKDGNIDYSQSGTHEELMQKDSYYKKAWQLQSH